MIFLDTEYSKYDTENKSWRNGLFWASIVMLIFLLLQPFGLRDKDFELKIVLFPAYSALAFLFSTINFIIVRRIIKAKKEWTIKNELLYSFVCIIPLTVLILLISSWIAGDMPINLYWYFKLFYHVTSLIIIILAIEMLYYTHKSSVIKIEHLSERVQKITGKLAAKLKDADIEMVPVNLEKESIEINRNKTVFIKSIGNYLEFYFRDNNNEIKKLIKRGRIHQAEKKLEVFPEFHRCHRAFIVNLKQVKFIKGNSKNARLVFDQKLEEIPVSRSQFKTLKDRLDSIISG